MDWTSLPFGMFAIIGSVLIAFFALAGHWITQHNENIRNARRLAYEAAISEWKTDNELYFRYRESGGLAEKTAALQLDDYILSHLALVDELRRIDAAAMSVDELAPVIQRGRTRNLSILALRKELGEKTLLNRTGFSGAPDANTISSKQTRPKGDQNKTETPV